MKRTYDALDKRAYFHHKENHTFGERSADNIARLIGSWRFIIYQVCFMAAWVTLNVVAVFKWHWDVYPFILLNLCLSTQAAFTGPILQLTQNRQAQLDRARDDRDDKEIGEILEINRDQKAHDIWTRTELTEQSRLINKLLDRS